MIVWRDFVRGDAYDKARVRGSHLLQAGLAVHGRAVRRVGAGPRGAGAAPHRIARCILAVCVGAAALGVKKCPGAAHKATARCFSGQCARRREPGGGDCGSSRWWPLARDAVLRHVARGNSIQREERKGGASVETGHSTCDTVPMPWHDEATVPGTQTAAKASPGSRHSMQTNIPATGAMNPAAHGVHPTVPGASGLRACPARQGSHRIRGRNCGALPPPHTSQRDWPGSGCTSPAPHCSHVVGSSPAK